MTIKSTLRWAITVAFSWTLFVSAADAALLGLIPDYIPDAKTWNSIDYVPDGGGGYHMDIDGYVTALDDYGPGISQPLGACSGGLACYTLDADFDGSGSFVSGSINISYTPNHTTDNGTLLTSGNLVTGTLTNFGFGGTDEAGLFEFTFDITSGDFLTVWNGINGGTVIDTRNLLDAASNPLGIGDWDTFGLMTSEFHALLDGSTTADTFIPVPAAVWLFGSGLLVLAGKARRRGRKTSATSNTGFLAP